MLNKDHATMCGKYVRREHVKTSITDESLILQQNLTKDL